MKGLKNRAYNIYFHLHTVSGISLAAVLFVIFFAGAVSLFKNQYYLWENPAFRTQTTSEVNFNNLLVNIQHQFPYFDFDDDTFIYLPTENNPSLNIYGYIKENGKPEEHFHGVMHPQTLQINNHPTSTVGETLLRLHYLDQIPAAGRLLAGFVSLFFIFAVVTGVLIHLKNIFTKFWAFSFKGALKQMWTNTHTVLGILGLPYQLMYAITGAFYLLLFLVLLPAVMFIFDGKIEKVFSLAYPSYGITYSDSAKVADNTANFVRITEQVTQQYPQFKLSAIQLHHYNKEDGAVSYLFTSKDAGMFFSEGFIGYRLKDGQELFNTLPGEKLFTIK